MIIATKMAIMPTTTSNSTSVKPFRKKVLIGMGTPMSAQLSITTSDHSFGSCPAPPAQQGNPNDGKRHRRARLRRDRDRGDTNTTGRSQLALIKGHRIKRTAEVPDLRRNRRQYI